MQSKHKNHPAQTTTFTGDGDAILFRKWYKQCTVSERLHKRKHTVLGGVDARWFYFTPAVSY